MRLLVFILLLSNIAFGQCPNIDFEQGNFSGWSGTRGNCCPINLTSAGIVNGRHTIMTGNGTDVNTCDVVTVVAPGSTFSARLGNDNVGAEAEGLNYSFTVTPQSNLITYQYAVVFEDPGHLPIEQPRFEASIVTANGTILSCTQFFATAGTDLSGFQMCDGFDNQGQHINVFYKDWSTIAADVSAFMGQTLTLKFRTGDCSQGGHFGYAYIDAKCGPLELSVDYCTALDSAVITAPVGFFTYEWSTGETTNPITVNPLVTDTVSCTLTSISGCVATVDVVLSPTIITPSFTYSNNCVGSINFTNTSTITNGSVLSNLWTYGDNTSTQNTLNGSHIYSNPGTYLVTLTIITADGCANSTAQVVTILPNPISNFTHTYVCLGDSVQFYNSSTISLGYNIDSWEWYFGDGNTSLEQNPKNLYLGIGNFNVTLITSTANSQCRDTISQVVSILNNPIANFIPANVCEGLPISFINSTVQTPWSTSSSYYWNFDYLGSTSLLQNPTFTYPVSGVYNVSLIAQNSNSLYTCRDTIRNLVEVYPKPIVNFIFDNACLKDTIQFTNLTEGNILNYIWNFGDNAFTNIVNPKHKYGVAGNYSVSLIAVTDNFCRDTLVKPINVYPSPIVQFEPNIISGCVPLIVNFTDNTDANSLSWLWNFGDGYTSNNQNTSHTYNNIGTYTVSLQVNTLEGCESTVSYSNLITTYPIPDAFFTYLPEFITDTNSLVYFYNASIGGNNYTWDFGDNSTDNGFNTSHQYPDSGVFHVTLVVENQYDCSDSYSVDIFIKATFGFFVPNAFTPNGNGRNETWFPVFRNVKDFKGYVFNRWGEEIYKGDIRNFSWDGTYKGELVQNDVYVYKFDVIDLYDEYHSFIGKLTIIK